MPGGPFNSSLTRVVPVFERLRPRTDDWVRALLQQPQPRPRDAINLAELDLRFLDGYWGTRERGLDPPVALLSWLIRNPTPQLAGQDRILERSLLARGDPETVEWALRALRSAGTRKGWHLLEGPTYPDALIETPDAFIVIEGKRIEPAPTVDTTWLSGRHQIWRHIDAAWELRGRRRVFGFFVVEGSGSSEDLPDVWQRACAETLAPPAVASSFPHRSADECRAITSCFLGAATWQRLCTTFGIELSDLPDRIPPRRNPAP